MFKKFLVLLLLLLCGCSPSEPPIIDEPPIYEDDDKIYEEVTDEMKILVAYEEQLIEIMDILTSNYIPNENSDFIYSGEDYESLNDRISTLVGVSDYIFLEYNDIILEDERFTKLDEDVYSLIVYIDGNDNRIIEKDRMEYIISCINNIDTDIYSIDSNIVPPAFSDYEIISNEYHLKFKEFGNEITAK